MNNYRSEIKFVCYKQNYSLIKNWIRFNKFNFFKEYDDRNINNIYFDSLDYKAFNDNLVGLPSRLKVRYRWYGNLFSNDKKNEGSLEFKFKKNIYGYKKIFKINDLTLNLNSNWKDIKNKILKKLTPEYKILFDINSEKILINRYKREYFISRDKKLRVTLDRNIEIFDQRTALIKPNFKFKNFTQDHLVIEFKFNKEDKMFLNDLDINIPIKASRNSKYINGVRSILGK
jgi:hypothetical protein|tara:strand:- start:96 stop:785 length:690 start_codon:yes stop_codon:yes gene_type:complete